MSEQVRAHYDALLAQHYTWMTGMPFAAKVAEQRDLFRSIGVTPTNGGAAIDLGSGPGFQALALAQLGYAPVHAIDTSRALLDELDARKEDLPITTALADLRDFARLTGPEGVAAIVCMGDTLTHLECHADVERLIEDARATLVSGGFLVLTFRDLSIELRGLDRILPVHADDDRIMTCVLEYEDDAVIVNDIIHVREGSGWAMNKSSYRKLRLAPAWVVQQLRDRGFAIRHDDVVGRLHTILAVR